MKEDDDEKARTYGENKNTTARQHIPMRETRMHLVRRTRKRMTAWTRRKGEALRRDLLSSSSEDEEGGETKWNKDVSIDDLLDGSYDEEDSKCKND
jgi:hypothetical protein